MSYTKGLLLLTTLLLIQLINAQGNVLTGRIVDKHNEDPVFGAYIFFNEKVMFTTDNLGNYDFTIEENMNLNDTLCISHIAYKKKCFSLADFKSNTVLSLERETFMLNEVIVHNGLKDSSPILKEIKKNYKTSMASSNNWSKINLKQVVSYKNAVESYLEVSGYAFMIGNDEKDPFTHSFIVPKDVRRTAEREQFRKLFFRNKRKGIKEAIGRSNYTLFRMYKFFSLLHPLNKKRNRHFFIKMNNSEWIGDDEYYVFEYKQISKKINYKTRNLNNLYGKFWVRKKDHMLYKEATSFNFEDLRSINLSIFYIKKDNKIYPKKIISNISHHHLTKKKVDVNIESILECLDINTVERKNYRRSIVVNYPTDYFLSKIGYNKDYWNKEHLADNPFEKELAQLSISRHKDIETLFIEGAHSEIYKKKHSAYNFIQSYMPKYKKLENKMKQDLNLK